MDDSMPLLSSAATAGDAFMFTVLLFIIYCFSYNFSLPQFSHVFRMQTNCTVHNDDKGIKTL